MSEKKKAIIIGSSSGVGRELAKILVQHNYIVGITGRRENLLNELAAENPDSYVVSSFDLMKTEEIIPSIEKIVADLNGLDLLVISAADMQFDIDLDYAIEYKSNLVNVTAFTVITNWAFKFFRQQNGGHLVALTSVAGFRGWRNNPAYNAGKAYAINYLEGLRNIAGRKKLPITVTNIIPGYLETAMKGKTFVFWVAPPEKAARIIYSAIRKKRKIAYVYRRWRFGAFIYKHLPNRIIEIF